MCIRESAGEVRLHGRPATGGNKYSRIAIIVQPVCAYGTAVFTGDDFKIIISNAATRFAQASVGSKLEIDITHFNVFSVLRATRASSAMR